jgi:uncharacterized membrane protein
MNIKPLLVVNAVLVAAMLGMTLWVWPTIPESVQLPVHWNLEGQVDRYGSKAEALLAMPAIAVVITVIFALLWRLDPRRRNIEASGKMWNAIGIGVVAFLAYLHGFLVLNATGRSVDMAEHLIPAMSVLFVVIGNYLSKTRSNWFAGVRTPWTLSSEYSWSKTHRLGGRLFMASGLLTLAAWFALGAKVAVFVMIGALLVTTIVCVIASYLYWKNDPMRAGAPANGDAS